MGYLTAVGITVVVISTIWMIVNYFDKKKTVIVEIRRKDEFYDIDIDEVWDELDEKSLCIVKKPDDDNT